MAYVVRDDDEGITVIILEPVEDAALGHVFATYGRFMPELGSLAELMSEGSQ